MTRDRPGLSRRRFLTGGSLSAWLAATHGPAAGAAGADAGPAGRDGRASKAAAAGPGGVGRIRSLRLRTAAPLAAMKRFYVEQMGLGIDAEGSRELTIRAGETPITFVRATAGEGGAPFYHFAFNIPENKLRAAREWQLERTALIPPPAGLRDPAYPDDVVHFRHWNAHSLFFWDPAGNLLEQIARHDLGNAAGGSFDSSDILYASEIGLIVDDVIGTAGELRAIFGLERYKTGSEQFTAVGDELGLLLVMRRGRNLGFGEGRPAEVFAAEVALRGARPARHRTPGYPFRITSG